MTLGKGIFLSAIAICLVWLYRITNEKWNWKKIAIYFLVACFSVGLLFGGGIYYLDKNSDRPKKIEEIWGIKLSDSKSELKFKKGTPQRIDSADSDWSYDDFESDGVTRKCTYLVEFDGTRIKKITVLNCSEYAAPYLNGISRGTPLEVITEKLGSTGLVSTHKNGLLRVYNYSNYNQFFILQKGTVRIFGIYNSDLMKQGFEFKDNG